MRRSQRLPLRAAVGATAATVIAALLGCGAPEESVGAAGGLYRSGRPDVILIVIDALRRDRVGIFGHDKDTTPTLDRLGRQGSVFRDAYTQASQTFNSTSTLLTSKYFPLLAKNRNYEPVPGAGAKTQERHALTPFLMEQNLTLAEVMSEGGYDTAGFFTNPHHHPTSGFFQGFESAQYLEFERGNYAAAPRVREEFIRWIDARQSEEPYFAYLHFMDPHYPQKPPKRLRERFVEVSGRNIYFSGVPEGDEVPSENDLRFMFGLYDASVRHTDNAIRGIVEDLKERDGWRDLVVIVTSDHGDEYMDHGGLGHGRTLEKEMIAAPMIAHAAPDGATGSRPELVAEISILARNLDVAPTIVDLAGLSRPDRFEGVSLVPWILGEPPVEAPPEESFAWVGNLRSLTTADWHMTWNRKSKETRLYDNRVDPLGLNDLSAEHPEVVAEMLARINELGRTQRASVELAARLDAEDPNQQQREMDPEIVEQLKSLGYLN